LSFCYFKKWGNPLLSYIDKLLYDEARDDFNIQIKILDMFFDNRFKKIIIDYYTKNEIEVVFHSQQIYLIMRYILKYGDDDNILCQKDLFKNIGLLLLYINDYCDEKLELKDNMSVSLQKKKVSGYLWSQGHFSYLIHKDFFVEITIC
jgi:hypothetical protein